jgi:hypothetical protein
MPHRPTPKQRRLLRTLAAERGQTFAVPHRGSDQPRDRPAQGAPSSTRCEATLDRTEVSRDLARTGDAAAAQAHEIVGYGASARWAGRDEVQA